MPIALNVGGHNFRTKTDLTSFVRQLISQYVIGSHISDEDRKFLVALFEYHPDAARKLKAGVSEVEVRLDDYGHKHFYIYNRAGGGEDISWTKCVSNAKAA
jgi:hypothetical protein